MNKDEGEKCLNLAFTYYNKGDYSKVSNLIAFCLYFF